MVKKTSHPASTRGHADYGWLATAHTFSFGSYHDPYRMNFGKLRVLNDDVVQGGGGFGAHGHENMEIISIPLQGSLAHGDSTGHTSIMRPNDVQVMSAGTGIMHTERNHSAHEPVSFLQLWILPETQNLSPRYAQHSFDPRAWSHHFHFLVGPKQQQGSLWINQQAVIARASVEAGKTVCYTLQQPSHGIYIFVIEGKISAAEEVLNKRDGMGVEGVNQLVCQGIETSDVLLIEVPM
jgi:quercetin 2,3-dioxygenase